MSKLLDKSYPSVRSKSVSSSARIQEHVEAKILKGLLKPGDRLDESQLAQEFGVSRTPVREALRGLIYSGLVKMRPNVGAIVASLSVSEIIEMFELMAELEAFAARLAADRHTEEDRIRLANAHADCKTIANGDKGIATFFEANRVFHDSIYLAAHNTVLRTQILTLDKRLIPYRRIVTSRPRRIAESISEHEVILEAIERGDKKRAGEVMSQHIELLIEDALVIARISESMSNRELA